MTLKDDAEGRKTLAVILSQCFDTMKLFGKEPEQMESAGALFKLVLSDFPIDKIGEAFAYHLGHSAEMPTPADIVNIIRRGNKPPFERAVYVSISKKEPWDRSRDEWAYMREYEEFQIHG